MCGICGFTGKENKAVLEGMMSALVHRGPDEDGSYAADGVSLGMRRLSIIDVLTGKQPVHNENKTLWAVFNGEIYNFKELRAELAARGHKFFTDHSDTEVLVHLYEEHGPDFAHRLNGMFAAAIFDLQKRELTLVRDRMGVKPLFYALAGGELVFGSEIKAILAHPAVKREMDYRAVYHYFTFKNIPAPMTAFRGISQLLPGERLLFKDGRAELKKWWTLDYSRPCADGGGEAAEKILGLLKDATRLRMISDVGYGAYLSGGVDSSAVVAIMAGLSEKPVKTFSLGYEDELKNKEADLHYARKVSKAFGTEHHEYIMSSRELVEDIEGVIGAFDQPFSGTISTYFLTKLIKKHVKVALSGDGADEIFGSYLSHRAAAPMHAYARLRAKAPAGAIPAEEARLLAPCTPDFLEKLYARSGGDEALWRYHLHTFTDPEKAALLSPEFLARAAGVQSLSLVRENFSRLTATDPLNRVLEMEWNTQFPDQVLAFVDFLSMAHSVEVRSPFLDYRLAEYCAGLPGSMKIRDGNVKDILKKAVGGLLPEGITARPKEGFVLPIFDWMSSRLGEYPAAVLSPERLARHGLLNAPAVAGILESFRRDPKAQAAKVWNLMMFQVWWEKYFS